MTSLMLFPPSQLNPLSIAYYEMLLGCINGEMQQCSYLEGTYISWDVIEFCISTRNIEALYSIVFDRMSARNYSVVYTPEQTLHNMSVYEDVLGLLHELARGLRAHINGMPCLMRYFPDETEVQLHPKGKLWIVSDGGKSPLKEPGPGNYSRRFQNYHDALVYFESFIYVEIEE